MHFIFSPLPVLNFILLILHWWLILSPKVCATSDSLGSTELVPSLSFLEVLCLPHSSPMAPCLSSNRPSNEGLVKRNTPQVWHRFNPLVHALDQTLNPKSTRGCMGQAKLREWVPELVAQVGASTPSTGRESFTFQHIIPHVPLWKVQSYGLFLERAGYSGWQALRALFPLHLIITNFREQTKCGLKPLEAVPEKIKCLKKFILTSEAPMIWA